VRRLLDPHTRWQALRWDRSEIAFGERARLGRIDIAGDYQDGVIGGVPFAIGRERVFGAQQADFVHPADCRIAVRMMPEQRGAQLLGEQ